MFCIKCGSEIDDDSRFCTVCGNPIGDMKQTETIRQPKGKRKTSPIMIFMIIGLSVLLIGAGIYIIQDQRAKTVADSLQNEGGESGQIKTKDGGGLSTNNENSDNDGSQYILSESNLRFLSKEDINDLSLQETNYAKNEIFARHGRRFDSVELSNYFNEKDWYKGIYDPDDFDENYSNKLLNEYEKYNAELLREQEYALNPDGYPLDE